MKYPNLNEEKKLWKKGYKFVIGIDEAGRGPLAGPVVAAAVMVRNFKFEIFNFKSILNNKILKQVKDSKTLSAKQREEAYNYFKKNSVIEWGVGIVSEKVIDKINILEATKLAMIKALRQVQGKLKRNVDFLILDGNFRLNINLPQKSIIKADQKIFSCALASIFAKVTRDRIMEKHHRQFFQYGFDKHKGYGTAEHFKMLKKHGPCKIHRKSFYPVSSLPKP